MKRLKKPFHEFHSCLKCGLSKFRKAVVLGEGVIPCDILFIGEGPGKSEDLRGKPFVGPSGKLLRYAISKASEKVNYLPSYYITNLVACRPTNFKRGPNRQPTRDEILSCWERLEKVIIKSEARKIVTLGKVAKGFIEKLYPESISLIHPAYILRKGGVQTSEFRQFYREIEKIFKEVKHG